MRFVADCKPADRMLPAMRSQRIVGIDYLRALFSVCVVVGHLGYVSPSGVFSRTRLANHVFTWSDFVNFYVIILSVPVFYMTAHFLLAQRATDKTYVKSYVTRIARLTVFWVAMNKMFFAPGWTVAGWLPTDVTKIIPFILSGGHSLYYFFVSLIPLTLITYRSKQLATRSLIALFTFSVLVVVAMPLISLHSGWYRLTVFWNPLNFLPYPFAAILVLRLAQSNAPRRIWAFLLTGLLSLFLLSAVLDWSVLVNVGFMAANRYALPCFARPSLVFLSILVLMLAIRCHHKPIPVISFMAKYSLALYCLHPFFIPVGEKFSGGHQSVALLITLVLSYGAALVLRLFLQKDLLP